MSDDCLFCKVIAGIIPVTPLYEDRDLIVIKDINPQAPFHALIIPKQHIATLNDLSADHDSMIGEMFRRASALAREHGYADRGYRTLFNTNREAGQSVFHLHLHILAGRPLSWPPG
jgi:histidine triad (HIT) family protein